MRQRADLISIGALRRSRAPITRAALLAGCCTYSHPSADSRQEHHRMSPLTLTELTAITRAVDAIRASEEARQDGLSRAIDLARYRAACDAVEACESLGVGHLVPDEDEIGERVREQRAERQCRQARIARMWEQRDREDGKRNTERGIAHH